jgi:hypothetical protein
VQEGVKLGGFYGLDQVQVEARLLAAAAVDFA